MRGSPGENLIGFSQSSIKNERKSMWGNVRENLIDFVLEFK